MYRNKSACFKLNPLQNSRSKSTTCPRQGVWSDYKQTAQLLQMAAGKVWNLSLSLRWFWIDCNQSFNPKQLQMKTMSKIPALTGWASTFDSNVVLAICWGNNHLSVVYQSSIAWSWISVLCHRVLSTHFSLDDHRVFK